MIYALCGSTHLCVIGPAGGIFLFPLRYCSRALQTVTDFVSYGIFSSENAYPCTVTPLLLGIYFHGIRLDNFSPPAII